MVRRSIAALLVVALLQILYAQHATAHEKLEQSTPLAQRVKSAILKLGVGSAARIEVRLRDETKVAGYISAANQDSFVVVEAATGIPTLVTYADVTTVKGHNWSTGAKIGVGAAIGFVGVLIILAVLGLFRG